MSNQHTITLEILRPGPSHNQLLSPLTNYLALCDNRGAVTLNMPFEHREILRQREALSYRVPRDQREAQLMQTAYEMGHKVLGGISTLNAAMAQTQYGQTRMIHLRLILSASELSLLPFELAIAPSGFPGESQPLLLQSIAPITLTREVRSAAVSRASWSRPPRILVISASPPGLEPVPLRAHMLALRRAIAPWVPAHKGGGIGRLITVLPKASVMSIREACARNDYTHIHILAHGDKYSEAGESRYGLALFDASGEKKDVVCGSRLTHALRTHKEDGNGFSSPNFVTLCTCESGRQDSVVFPGASLAHELHESGLPWVIASQFPLSMLGSTLLTEVLYNGLLRGDDPRLVLHHLRQCLRSEASETHDWASVVAYAAVPPDFDEQVAEGRQQQSVRAINVAFERVDELLEDYKRKRAAGKAAEARADQDQIREILSRIDAQLERMRESVPDGMDPTLRGRRVGIMSRQGSVEKRRAYIEYQQQRDAEGAAVPRTGPWLESLHRARRSYLAAAKLELNKHWPLAQYLSLSAILGVPIRKDFFTVARTAAELDLESDDPDRRAWANATLCELSLLEVLWNDKADVAQIAEYARSILRITGRDSFHAESTRRQLERYLDFGVPSTNPHFTSAVRAALAALEQTD